MIDSNCRKIETNINDLKLQWYGMTDSKIFYSKMDLYISNLKKLKESIKTYEDFVFNYSSAKILLEDIYKDRKIKSS